MQRLDHEYMLRPSEAPLLKKKPSDYMRDMYYSSQPMEIQDYDAMATTFRMINAETQLLYSSDYPHWDLLFGLSLGFRFAVDRLGFAVFVGKGQAQYPGRHGRAAIQARTAQRQAKSESEEVREFGRGIASAAAHRGG
ncbi:MAG TPA: hypothetical protein VMV19_06065, partial [Xanthobacteraceae bacterium]|nr:hypothetical protein [Xanthobacteraceae bacterium]